MTVPETFIVNSSTPPTAATHVVVPDKSDHKVPCDGEKQMIKVADAEDDK
jgi:hypothetical protein